VLGTSEKDHGKVANERETGIGQSAPAAGRTTGQGAAEFLHQLAQLFLLLFGSLGVRALISACRLLLTGWAIRIPPGTAD